MIKSLTMNWIIYIWVTASSLVVPCVTSWSNALDYEVRDSLPQMIHALHQRMTDLEALFSPNFVDRKVDILERELHQMKEENTQFRNKLKSQEEKLDSLQQDHLDLQNVVRELMKHIKDCKEKGETSSMQNMLNIKSESSTPRVLTSGVNHDLENEKYNNVLANDGDETSNGNFSMGVLGSKTTLSRRVLEKERQIFQRQAPQRQVAFHAMLSVLNLNNLVVGQTIVFDLVVTNIGGGYHVHSGMFVAPVDGIYVFHVSVMSASGKHQDLRLVKDGTVVQHVYADARSTSGYRSASITVPMQVNKGQEVWVQAECCNDATIHGNTYTIFTGWLTSSGENPTYISN